MIENLREAFLQNLDFLAFLLVAGAGVALLRTYLRRRTGLRMGTLPALVCLAVAAACWWPVDWAGERAQEGIRNLLVDVAPLIADQLERGGHHRISLSTPPDDPTYLALIETQKRLLRLAPRVSDTNY